MAKYSFSEDWYNSPAGKETLHGLTATAELTDFFYEYLLALRGQKETVGNEDLYKMAFIMADSMSETEDRESLLSPKTNPFAAYIKTLTRTVGGKHLCYELLLIMTGAVDSFDCEAELYSTKKHGFSDSDYEVIALEKDVDLRTLFTTDYTGKKELRQTLAQIVWIIGGEEFLRILK